MSGCAPGCPPSDGSAVPPAILSDRAIGRFVDASVVAAVELAVMVPFGCCCGTAQLADGDLVRHRIAPDVAVAAPDGQHSLVPHSQIARPQ